MMIDEKTNQSFAFFLFCTFTFHFIFSMLERLIPSSKESLPVIGLGTWQTFDVDEKNQSTLIPVLEELHRSGGKLIDSSPMYGRSEAVIGNLTSKFKTRNDFFYATKVWTTGKQAGIDQMKSSMKKMQRDTIDLMQIHNLLDWKTHLPVLKEWKEAGIIKYIGITHYQDAMHDELAKIISAEKIDFVQFNYSIDSLNAEKRLLNVAGEKGVATLINRPFGEGRLFQTVKGKKLPECALEFGVVTWSDYFLKFILANPNVTCVIPATSDVVHAKENFKAGAGPIPDYNLSRKMITFLDSKSSQ